MSAAPTTATLAVTLAHAISYLTRPLVMRYSSVTINKLQAALADNLTAAYTPTWIPSEPLRGSGRRCLTLSPLCNPPRPIYSACATSKVSWVDWIRLLGGLEFDMFIDPGCISVRFGKWGTGTVSQLITVWSAELEAETAAQTQQQRSKSLAQLLLEKDEEDDEVLFSMIAKEVRASTWMTPLIEQFPAIPATTTAPTMHSRSSSRSSSASASSGFSFSSDESLDSCGTLSSVSSSPARTVISLSSSATSDAPSAGTGTGKSSRRERARQARVFVDSSKIEVTPYDGGKTTVLTGGVMLGAAPSSKLGRKVRRA